MRIFYLFYSAFFILGTLQAKELTAINPSKFTNSFETVVPVFNQIAPLCSNTIPPPLPTTSINGIQGAWSPNTIDTTQSATYIFTPNAGQDAMVVSMTITIIPNATLTLTSSIATTNQTVCDGSPIMAITYVGSNGATSAVVTGLPPGVTGNFNSNVFTITGSPTAPGYYMYTVSTIGGCDFSAMDGTIIVLPRATVIANSDAATQNQTVCLNNPINPIEYTVGNGATGVDIIGGSVPPGITAAFNAGSFTLSGIPNVAGVFNFLVATIGGCDTAYLPASITVKPNATTNVFCDPSQVTAPNSVYFDWSGVVGASSYEYSYAINGAPAVTGLTLVSHHEVFGVLPGQSVLFTVTNATGVNCFQPAATTCSNLAMASFDTPALQAFPNPVNSILNITNSSAIANVKVLNALGQQVLDEKYHANAIQVDMSTLQPGIYFIKIAANMGNKTIKVSKN